MIDYIVWFSEIVALGDLNTEWTLMSLGNNIALNIYSIAILLIIYFHALKFFEKDSMSDKLYMWILHITTLMLGIDILGRFDGNTSAIYPVFNHIGNFLIFLLNPVLPSLWVAYAHFQVFHDERRIKRLFYPLCAINVINVITLILSQFLDGFTTSIRIMYTIEARSSCIRLPLQLYWCLRLL